MNFLVLISIACLYVTQANYISPWKKLEGALRSRNETARTMLKLMSEPQILDRYWNKFFARKGIDEVSSPVNGFSWNNCGSPSDPVIINKVSISPDPIVIPGSITVSFDVVLKINITSPLQVNVDAKKRVVFVWIDLPCLDNIGSCIYEDACQLFPRPCPTPVIKAGLPCKCPIPANHYHMDSGTFHLPNIPLPAFIEDGDFKVRMEGSMKAKSIFCYEIQFSLEKR